MLSPQMNRIHRFTVAAALLCGASCQSLSSSEAPRLAGAEPVDHLIQPGETHFAHLWQLTHGGNNAEGYWSFAEDRLCLQHEGGDIACDRIYVTAPDAPRLIQVSNGLGKTTCSYFMPGDKEVIFASTQSHHAACPPPIDKSDGYVWAIHPEFDLYVVDLETGAERRITDQWGYDAEATISPLGDSMVFTSTRSGDIELWTSNLDGSNPRQVTHELGYDGGAFFSHDGRKLVFRATRFTDDGPGTREKYVELLKKDKIRPHMLDIYTCNVDGSERKRVTDLGGASWAPYFFPGDQRIIFSTNHHDPRPQKFEFDLFAIGADGRDLEQITTYVGFDSFPMFTRDGKWLVFASNRGGQEAGETNLFLARWK